jgi:hypothetical protein
MKYLRKGSIHYSQNFEILSAIRLFRMLVEHPVALALNLGGQKFKKGHSLDLRFGCWDVPRLSN